MCDLRSQIGEIVGQQLPSDTGPIDLLAVSHDGSELLVIELKKGRRFRKVPVPKWAIGSLDLWANEIPTTGPLLRQVDRWGKVRGGLSGNALCAVVDRLCDSAGIERCGCHGLRRYAITNVLRSSDVGLARTFAGHADSSTTLRSYDTRGLEDLARVVVGMPLPGN